MKAKTKEQYNADKDFLDTFRKLSNVHGGWQTWSDFVHLAAYAISNAVDPVHREQRESEYMKIISRYTEAEGQAHARLLAATVEALEENPDQDFLGRIYMNLEMGNKYLGQCFTPFDVCRMMAKINCPNLPEEIRKKGWVSVMDCCIGGGAMLIAFASECRAQKVDFQNHCLFVGQDIDHNVAMMAYIQLSLLGCPGYIVVGNALTEPLAGNVLYAPMERETFITPMYCSTAWTMRRAWHALDVMMQTAPAAETAEIPESLPEAENAPTPEPISAAEEPTPEQVTLLPPIIEANADPKKASVPTYTVKRSRKEFAAAQISMFDGLE